MKNLLNFLDIKSNFNIVTVDIQSCISPFVVICVSLAIIEAGYRMYTQYHHDQLLNRMVESNLVRAEEGINNDVTLTPENFIQNPELAEIFDITDVENGININLETQEQTEFMEFQIDTRNVIEFRDDFLTRLFDLGLNWEIYAFDILRAVSAYLDFIISLF
jgi:hypothetical protein